MIHSYKDLIVWQRAIQLVIAVYEYTSHFPKSELFGLVSQMRRAVVSIASNIAEGRHRGTRADFLQFLRVALGSAAELETQLIIAKQLPIMADIDATSVEALLGEVLKMLRQMLRSMNPKSSRS